MDDLIPWLRAELDEDERVANEMGELDSTARNGIESTAGYGALQLVDRFDRERLLREVEAKRRILDAYEKALDRRRLFRDDVASAGALLQMVAVVKLLALPYSDRPGRPSTEE